MRAGVAVAVELQVLSATRLDLEVTPLGRRPRVRGRLMDNVNQGVGGATIRLEVRRQGPRGGQAVLTRSVQTDPLGFFDERLSLEDGSYSVNAWYAAVEGGTYEGCSAQRRLEVARWEPRLRLEVPRLVHVGAGEVAALTVGVSLGAEAGDTAGEVRTVALRGGERGWSQALALDGASGRGALTLRQGEQENLLGWGRQTLRADYRGDDLLGEARADAEVILVRSLEVSLTAARVREQARRGVMLQGHARSADADLAGARLILEVRREGDVEAWQGVGEVKVGEKDGSFSVLVEEEALPPGVLAFQVRLIPDVGAEVRSRPAVVEVERSGLGAWVPWLLGGLVVGGGLLGVLAVVAARLVAWWCRVWTGWRRQRALGQPQTVAPLSLGEVPPEVPDLPDVIGGRVFDTLEGVALGGVRLTLRPQGAEQQSQTLWSEADGGFLLRAVPAGRYWLEAEAHGYVTARVEVRSPHDGSLRYFRLNLTPVRQAVRERYAWLLDQYAPQRGLWGLQTPQEVRQELGALLHAVGVEAWGQWGLGEVSERLQAVARDPSASVGALWEVMTALIEEVYFSSRLYPASLLADIDQLCARLAGPLTSLKRSQSVQHRASIGQSRSVRSAAREVG